VSTGHADAPAAPRLRPDRVPPGPSGRQHLRSMRDAPLDFVTALTTTYGDITRHEVDGESVYLLNRPDFARHVLKENGGNYTKDRTPDDYMLRPLLGNGLLTSNGTEWARQRHLCAPAFRPGEVDTFGVIITEAARHLLDRWRPAISAGASVRVDHDLTALTLSVVVKAMLGADISGIGEGFGRAVDAANRFIGHYSPEDDPGDDTDAEDTARRQAGFLQARVFLDRVVRTVIAARRATGEGGRDLLAAMLASHDGPSGRGMSDTELRDQVLTVIMAGHETTAKALTWTLYLIDRHREVAARVRAEVDGVLAGRTPEVGDIPRLVMCRRAIEESMRLYPPVWLISRRAAGADVIGGYDVAPGTLVCVSPYALHRHPDYWDAPEDYIPDRFAPQQVAARPSHLYLPFGGGPRICIGQHFAMAEAVLVLATLMQAVRLELAAGFLVETEALVTLRPRHGMVMIPRPR
jgi:cytochrome P450